MKKLLIALLLMAAVPVCAQRVDKPGEPYDYYVTVVGFQNMANKLRIHIEWPDGKFSKTAFGSDGKKVEFNSLTDMFLYMSKRGWSYVSEFIDGRTYNFIFKKTVTTDEQAKEYFYFEDDFKK